MQDVRTATLGEGRALFDAEAVLFIDDGHREIAELDVALDQRVRADCDLHVARPDQLSRQRVLLGRERAREKRNANAKLGAKPFDGEKVLLSEGFGRRHQRTLVPGFDRAEQCIERDDRLARADIALQQPLHRRLTREIRGDLRDRALLRVGQRERERRAVACDQLAGRVKRLGEGLVTRRRATGERELQDQQLVERQPPPTFLSLLQ